MNATNFGGIGDGFGLDLSGTAFEMAETLAHAAAGKAISTPAVLWRPSRQTDLIKRQTITGNRAGTLLVAGFPEG